MTHAQAPRLDPQKEPDAATVRAPSARAREVIARLSQRLAHIPDDQFLNEYVLAMHEALCTDYFMIGRYNPFSNIMRSVRLVAEGKLSDNITYSLDGTPCASVLDADICVHKANVAGKFPFDKMLKDMHVEGYVGVRLRASAGDKFGIVVGMTKKPIADTSFVVNVIEYFRDRVSYALETSEILDRYSWVVAEASDGVWDWDVVTGGTIISERIQTMLGYDKGEGPYDLMQIERAVHPDDRPKQVEALHKHLNHGALYDIKIRLQDRNGVYRWFRSRGRAIRNEEGRPIRMVGSFSDIHDLVIEAQRERTPR